MSESAMRYARPLGWAALAGAPILLAALAVVSARPGAPASIVTHSAIAAWIAGTLAFGAALIHARGGVRVAKIAGALSAAIVIAVSAFLVWSASALSPRAVALDDRERAELVAREGRLVHPHLGLSIPAPEGSLRPSRAIVEQAREAGGAEWARAHRVWAWEGADAELVVDLARAPRADATALGEVTDQLATELERAGRNVQRRTKGPLIAELEASLRGRGTVLARVAVFEQAGRAYRVVVTAVTREPSRWRPWLDAIVAGSS
jgi:hypothetical protein